MECPDCESDMIYGWGIKWCENMTCDMYMIALDAKILQPFIEKKPDKKDEINT